MTVPLYQHAEANRALRPAQMLEPVGPVLSSWLGPGEAGKWLGLVGQLPICSRLFLEFHPAAATPRCDIITSVLASDGSLSAWQHETAPRDSDIHAKILGILRKWNEQLIYRRGSLRANAICGWMEYDLLPPYDDLGCPALGIALMPRANLKELAVDFAEFDEAAHSISSFQRSVSDRTSLYDEVSCSVVAGAVATWTTC
jgi:hypothetical protein